MKQKKLKPMAPSLQTNEKVSGIYLWIFSHDVLKYWGVRDHKTFPPEASSTVQQLQVLVRWMGMAFVVPGKSLCWDL